VQSRHGRGQDVGLISSFIQCLAAALDVPFADLPQPDRLGSDWKGHVRQWLARRHLGLVQLADATSFNWPGYWIAVAKLNDPHRDAAVLMFGSPSGVVLSPAGETLVGRPASDLDISEGYVIAAFEPVRRMVTQHPSVEGQIVALFVAEKARGAMRAVERVSALAGRGLEGDRYAAKAGTFTPTSATLKGYDLTLIESEALDSLTLPDGSRLGYAEARRNVVTKGVELNALVGRKFVIGDVVCFGQRLCEPCSHLERLTKPGALSLLVHRGGLRADVLTDGELHSGDAIHALPD
jgi:hypothetical protein